MQDLPNGGDVAGGWVLIRGGGRRSKHWPPGRWRPSARHWTWVILQLSYSSWISPRCVKHPSPRVYWINILLYLLYIEYLITYPSQAPPSLARWDPSESCPYNKARIVHWHFYIDAERARLGYPRHSAHEGRDDLSYLWLNTSDSRLHTRASTACFIASSGSSGSSLPACAEGNSIVRAFKK